MLAKKFKFEVENEGIVYTATRIDPMFDMMSQYRIDWFNPDLGRADMVVWRAEGLEDCIRNNRPNQRKWLVTEVIEA